ncbi:MAG: DUF1836 domain-containing protein [Clostridiaceae bacterium]|nr:DUF1836 domain-containing protein [Clostridiaceae bacterium]
MEKHDWGNHDQIGEKLGQLKEKLASERPVRWQEFPDIGLYKDQVLSYMFRQLINFEGEGQLTSAMINNYIKDGLLPRTDGKKYSREHLAGLTEICLLKQVLSVRDTGFLLKQELSDEDHADFYTKFVQILDSGLKETADLINADWDMEALSDMTLRLAVSSYCGKLACERLIEIMREKVLSEEKKKQEKKPDKKADKKPE